MYGIAGQNFGVYGKALNQGVYGEAQFYNGVYGLAKMSYGLYGFASNTYGVYGNVGQDYGVYGYAGGNYGVYGNAQNRAVHGMAAHNIAVCGVAGANLGILGTAGQNYGVHGSASQNYGVYGSAPYYGVYGNAGNYGVYGNAGNYGVYGNAFDFGVYGAAAFYGVFGTALDQYGVVGLATNDHGVYGRAGIKGVVGEAYQNGVYGNAAVNYGVHGRAMNYGVYGYASTKYGGYFAAGDDVNAVFVNGSITLGDNSNYAIRRYNGAIKAFTIDHPLDPQNKVLRHYCLEAPEVWNVYKGNVMLKEGKATVTLPEYYDRLNLVGSESYQLTPIGDFADVIIKEEVRDNAFVIAGTKDIKVSWMITVQRNDPACREDLARKPVEQAKCDLSVKQMVAENRTVNTFAGTPVR